MYASQRSTSAVVADGLSRDDGTCYLTSMHPEGVDGYHNIHPIMTMYIRRWRTANSSSYRGRAGFQSRFEAYGLCSSFRLGPAHDFPSSGHLNDETMLLNTTCGWVYLSVLDATPAAFDARRG